MSENAAALERALTALEGLTPEHAAIVEHARTLARQIDRDLLGSDKLHSEYRQVCKNLLDLGRKKDLDAFEKLLRELRGEEAP